MNVVNYYTNVYNEENRLGNNCDNRHKVERIVKSKNKIVDFVKNVV